MRRLIPHLLTLFATFNIFSEVKVPRFISSNMILQRDVNLNIWGWADPNENIVITFSGNTFKGKTGKDGKWSISVPPMKAGGPYEMSIKGKNEILIHNILMGDVYLCSGQSNMGWTVGNSGIYQDEIKSSHNTNIRQFTVRNATSNVELEDLASDNGWQEADSTTTASFSAVSYFMAKDLYARYQIPIGIINSSWGGSSIEFWMSKEAIKSFPELQHMYKKEDDVLKGKERNAYREPNLKAWVEKGLTDDQGEKGKWYRPDLNTSDWKEVFVPSSWENHDYPDLDGVVWYRKEITMSKNWIGKETTIFLSFLDDRDLTYINGQKIGETDGYNKKRKYTIPAGLLKEGKNSITIKLIDYGGGGGFSGNDLYLESSEGRLSLVGDWKYKPGVNFQSLPEYMTAKYAWRTDWRPSTVYNAQIAPLIKYPIKAIVWYQGEGNAGTFTEAYAYKRLLTDYVKDYRNNWKSSTLPFIYVQLPNWKQPDMTPSESVWSVLRESQASVLKLPATGMVVAIDLGEANDIHPKNKLDVGKRIALMAEKVVYGENVVYTGPSFESMTVEGNTVRIKFKTYGSKLKLNDRYGYLKGFMLAGKDDKYQWAQGHIDSDSSVIISSVKVPNPVSVRYAWADNPDDLNLYNEEGLPAAPFRTKK